MAVVSSRRSGRRKADHIGGRQHRPWWAAILFFGVIVTATPLAFGAVDRMVQVALLTVLAIGLLVRPPALVSLPRRAMVPLLGLAFLLVAKEFAPAAWFGTTPWRVAVEQSYGLRLPWTHHPEPGRAVDALLAAGLAILWFLWVRTLAAHRETRVWLVWAMAGSALVVAVVSFATQGIDPKAIYGLRFTPGWQGFGPFPNRNHTASFLAMGALVGAGCVTWAGVQRYRLLAVSGAVSVAVILAALLQTQSRGGLLALGVGTAIFLLLVLTRLRSRRAVGLTLAAVLVAGAFALAFGASALERFTSSTSEVSNISRVLIWKDALSLWRDAPLLGYGAGSFGSVFPLRQTLALDNQVILHPESSWILWLVELGAVPLVFALLLAVVLVRSHVRALFERQSSFFLLSGALAAVVALLSHALIDVPGHRWGTMAFAIAAIALICPAARITTSPAGPRAIALLPLVLAAFWAWPFLHDEPLWSPSTLARTIDRAQVGAATEQELQVLVPHFPLNAKLHQFLGAKQLQNHGRLGAQWEQHFQIATRLNPGSWATPIYIAGICRPYSPGHALHYWQMALERAGWRRDELFGRALSDTADIPGASSTWAGYVESHPELLLIYAQMQPSSDAAALFARWWQERAGATDLHKGEIEAFYELAGKHASLEQIHKWVKLHPERRASDLRQWAALFHLKGEDERAWDLLKEDTPDPAFPSQPPRLPMAQLETAFRLSPEGLINAQALAHARSLAGNEEGAREIIVEVAKRENSPLWFRQKAAHLLAQAGQTSEAVAILLNQNP